MPVRKIHGAFLSTASMLLIAAQVAGEEGEANPEGRKESLTAQDCLACHESDEPVVKPDDIQKSVHGVLGCTDCHMDVVEVPHPKKPGKVDCAMCHDDAAARFSGSIHGSGNKKDVPSCTTCHGSHLVLPPSNPASPVSHGKIAALCIGCHENQKIVKDHALPGAAFIEKYLTSIHGMKATTAGAAVCTDCHTAHAVKPVKDESSSISRAMIPETCSQCHPDIFEKFVRSSHGAAWKAKNPAGPVCSTCHPAHEVQAVNTETFRLHIAGQCGSCHEDRVPSYGDTFHGKATSMGYAITAKCSDCHTAHLNLPQADPRSSIHASNLAGTCGRCHTGATAKFAAYDPHPDPKDRKKSALLYVINLFMQLLLMAVFGFFGIHTLLWLQRSIVALLRGEVRRRWEENAWVVRFSPPHRLTHVLIVVSFIGLGLTGLPLRFHHAEWARWFDLVLGGIESARLIHRVCAVITFGYAVLHVATMARQFLAGKRGGALLGSSSIFPGTRDLVDLYNNLRWFLYMGRSPRLGRWTYWEKFDYFAVFWGIPVIGLSGLMMWFPEFFTRIISGEWLNVALLVHSDEALLALGFIFTFHFFHNHMRPENFPIDTVIFTGRLPLSRFREERPDEYEMLVKEGRLNEIMADPPSRFTRVVSCVFGATALVLGLLCIAAIFTTALLSM